MALLLFDRVQQTGTANTTVSFTLTGTLTGFQSFSTVGNGNTTYYSALDQSGNWEVGYGTYSTTGPTLTRTTILSSSNSGSAVTFSGTVNIWIDYPAEKSVNKDANGNVNILTYVPNTATTIGTLNVGDGTYSFSQSGQIATFAASDNVVNGINVQNTSSSNTAYSAVQVGANNYNNGYFLEIGTNSSTYSYSAAGYANNNANQPNVNYIESNMADLAIITWNANNIHFIQNASTSTVDSMTLYYDGGVSLGGLGSPGIGNIAINNAVVGFTAITSAGGTTTLTSASTQVQTVTGSLAQTIKLPVATTLLKGTFYTISNASSGLVTVTDSAGTTLETLTTGGAAQFLCIANSTSAGTFGVRVFASANTTWGNATLNYGGSITGATWNGNTIAYNYGGTGLTTFSAANNAIYSTSASALTAGTLPVLAGGTGVTTSTGTGSVVLNTSPSLVTPALGTPVSGNFSTGTFTWPIFNQNTTGTAAGLSSTLVVGSGGTGVTTLTGLAYGNGTSAFTAATASQIVSAIGSTAVSIATNLAGGAANQISYQTAANTNGFITAPTTSSTYLQWTGSAFAWASISSGTTTNSLTFNNGGAGAASGTAFNGSTAYTISYNTIGASPLAGSSSLTTVGTISSGTWQGSAIQPSYVATLNQNTTGSAGSVANALTFSTGLVVSSGTTYNGSAAITLSIPQAITTTSSVQFGSFGGGAAAAGSGGGAAAAGAAAVGGAAVGGE